jgi:hypothetical protein
MKALTRQPLGLSPKPRLLRGFRSAPESVGSWLCRAIPGERDRRRGRLTVEQPSVGRDRIHLAEDGPLLRDVTAEIERAVARELVEDLALLAAYALGPGSSSSVR